MERVAADRSLRASIAAIGAERLMLHIVEEVHSAIVCSPEVQQVLDDLGGCAMATSRVATAFASGSAVEDQIWDVALATLSRINLRIWRRANCEAFADHVLLMDVMESMLADLLARSSVCRGKVSSVAPRGLSPAQLADMVDGAILSAQDLTGDVSVLSVQVLVGVALRAMSDAG